MSYLSQKDYTAAVSKILSGKVLEGDEALHFVNLISKFESMLDDADDYDVQGTEGWKRMVDWK